MKIYKHLFECEYPAISEDLVWAKHPKFDIELNQYCHFRSLDPKTIKNTTGYTEKRLAYEIFRNTQVPDYVQLFHLNNNPYDCHVGNLALHSLQLKRQRKEFYISTAFEMAKREKVGLQICETVDEYWEILQIPNIYVKHWKLLKAGKLK